MRRKPTEAAGGAGGCRDERGRDLRPSINDAIAGQLGENGPPRPSSVSLSSTAARSARARQLKMRSAPTRATDVQPRVVEVQIKERPMQKSRVRLWRVAIPTAATHV